MTVLWTTKADLPLQISQPCDALSLYCVAENILSHVTVRQSSRPVVTNFAALRCFESKLCGRQRLLNVEMTVLVTARADLLLQILQTRGALSLYCVEEKCPDPCCCDDSPSDCRSGPVITSFATLRCFESLLYGRNCPVTCYVDGPFDSQSGSAVTNRAALRYFESILCNRKCPSCYVLK